MIFQEVIWKLGVFNDEFRLFTIKNQDNGPNTLVKAFENGSSADESTYSGYERGQTFNDYFFGGNRLAGLTSGTFSHNFVAEFILFSDLLDDTEKRKIESYLAVKYGFTLDNSEGDESGDYLSASGTLLWDASLNPEYHNNIIGLGRDDLQSLHQKQSHYRNDEFRIYVGSLEIFKYK